MLAVDAPVSPGEPASSVLGRRTAGPEDVIRSVPTFPIRRHSIQLRWSGADMRSRRQLLAGLCATAGVLVGSATALAREREDAGDGWPMARYDPAGTVHDPDAVGPKDGVAVAWRSDIGSAMPPLSAPILVGGTLYAVGCHDLIALDSDTGEVRFTRGEQYWSSPTRATARTYRSDALAVSGRAGVHGLSADGGYELFGLSIGTERWHSPGSATRRWSSSTPREPSPVAADGTVYTIDPGTDRLLALDASTAAPAIGSNPDYAPRTASPRGACVSNAPGRLTGTRSQSSPKLAVRNSPRLVAA